MVGSCVLRSIDDCSPNRFSLPHTATPTIITIYRCTSPIEASPLEQPWLLRSSMPSPSLGRSCLRHSHLGRPIMSTTFGRACPLPHLIGHACAILTLVVRSYRPSAYTIGLGRKPVIRNLNSKYPNSDPKPEFRSGNLGDNL
jgi:hypothetical protein